tara:strand:+ start:2699 stop:3340 length:642 start_codon:yes stop_codon:yes gene_type:complete
MTYQEMLRRYAGHWMTDPEALEDIMNRVAYHESRGRNIYQHEGGPGAGLFQYERWHKDPKTGKYGQAAGMTARNRLALEFGDNVPEWLYQKDMNNPQVGFDASLLTPEQQRMLFLADKRHHPTATMNPEKIGDLSDWWANYHWKGGLDKKKQRMEKFASDEDLYWDKKFAEGAVSDNPELLFSESLEEYDRYKQPVDDLMAGYNKVNNAFTKK